MDESERKIVRNQFSPDPRPEEFVAPYDDDLAPHPLGQIVVSGELRTIPIPEKLTLEEAYRAMVFFVQRYYSLEKDPGESFILFYQYMLSDPATGQDFTDAIRRMIATNLDG